MKNITANTEEIRNLNGGFAIGPVIGVTLKIAGSICKSLLGNKKKGWYRA